MKIKQLVPFVLILALAGCSESPKEATPKKGAQQKTAASTADTSATLGNVVKEEKIKTAASSTQQQEENVADAVQTAPPVAEKIMRDEAALLKEYAGLAKGLGVEGMVANSMNMPQPQPAEWNTESYNAVTENGFINTANDPLSTFSIDVDTASYSNVRRFINEGRMPPKGSVRIEEMINYFSYSYPQPNTEHPFSVTTESGPCPWNGKHKLVRIGLKAKDIDKKDLPPSNLVFLIDVSGSMSAVNKLPLLQQSMKMLIKQMNKDDRISMVVYAGNDSVVLEPTAGSEQQKIMDAVNSLGAGGSTHASSGIVTAYKLAEQVFMPGGNNRIILASDGDFNVGTTSRDELQRLIEEKRKSGVYLTVLGFGMGNYHDDTMEILADKGNGNYAYIDSLLEAKKVMVKEMSGTLFALAGDVKIQVEFNPALVGAYRLIGYENRALADEDFNDDKKDAGEIGVGHTVTALYELIPAGAGDLPSVDQLKYQKSQKDQKTETTPDSTHSDELMTVKLRYKPLQSEKSVLLSSVVKDHAVALDSTSNDFRFAAAVAGYGMLLTDSNLVGELSWQQVLGLAKAAKDKDEEGYRAEFIRLVEMTELLTQ